MFMNPVNEEKDISFVQASSLVHVAMFFAMAPGVSQQLPLSEYAAKSPCSMAEFSFFIVPTHDGCHGYKRFETLHYHIKFAIRKKYSY
jgi:hypothetical protein